MALPPPVTGFSSSQADFVQNANRELRDPLTICLGYLEMLGDDPEESRRTVALVVDELDRMGRILDALSMFAEVDRPDFLHTSWIDLEPFTQELVMRAAAAGPRDWKLHRVSAGTFFADREQLIEAVMHLVDNAVHHTVEGDTIAIGSSLGDDEVRLWVQETGSGISSQDRPHVFDRFSRGTGAYRRYRGSGLGLAIVKTIAEAHSGRVELVSRPGEGSTFTIVVPREQPAEVVAVPDAD